jgi:hypothetical protein
MTEKGHKSEFLLVIGEKAETTHSLYVVPTPVEYWLLTTFPRERWYRRWWIETHSGLSPIESFTVLAQKYPHGLSQIAELPEERSGEVGRAGVNSSTGAQKTSARSAMTVRKAATVLEEARA